MAWTDQCRIAAVQTINKVAEDMGVSVRKAIAEVSKEADIPANTLQRWYYPRSEVKNDPTFKDEDESNDRAEVGPNQTIDTVNFDKRHRVNNRKEVKPQTQPTKTQQAPVAQIATEAHQIAHIVISQLTRIRKDDPLRDEAYDLIIKFIADQRAASRKTGTRAGV